MKMNSTKLTEKLMDNSSYEWVPQDMTLMSRFIVILDLYFVPVIIIIGLIGNTTSFVVFTSTHLRKLSSSVYLAALAVADNGFLLSVFIMWTVNIDFDLHSKPGWCQLFVFLTYFFSFLSVWYVVAFTVERFIAVCFPFKRNTVCTVTKARIIVSCMASVAFLFYNFALWTTTVTEPLEGHPECRPRAGSIKVVQVINNIDTVITLIIPMIIIIVLNVRIAHRMKSMRSQMKQIIGRCPSTGSDASRASNVSNQITNMLLVVSSTFVVLNLPSHAFRVHHFITGLFNKALSPSQTYADCQVFFQYVYYLNFSINIFLYSLCGKNFRHALAGKCCGTNRIVLNGSRWSMRRRDSERSGSIRATTVWKFGGSPDRDTICLDQITVPPMH